MQLSQAMPILLTNMIRPFLPTIMPEFRKPDASAALSLRYRQLKKN